MQGNSPHTFHIPVMGLGYTVDTPLKVARFGISSVVSIIEDSLLEQMREFLCNKHEKEYFAIDKTAPDYRACRITSYLDLLHDLLQEQMRELKNQLFEKGNDIVRYFEMQDSNSFLRMLYENMKSSSDEFEKDSLQKELRNRIVAGSIDVNIMTKCDRTNYAEDGSELSQIYSDALSALRGYANSKVNSSVVFSAGLNPRLFSYCESFDCFFPDEKGELPKKIVIKVSDYRSALIQGKFLAKKGLWVSEFRIESGLNCGGHAFPTEGILLGPILEEFKNKRNEMRSELFEMCNAALKQKKSTTVSK